MKKIDASFLTQIWSIRETELVKITEFFSRSAEASRAEPEAFWGRAKEKEKLKYKVENGYAVIPVHGVIAKNVPWYMDGTSTKDLAENIAAALEDASVSTIVLDVDSPGGTVSGVAEVADLIYASRGKKPIHTYAQGLMASAAYWIGAAADKVYATKATEVGSIGVYSVAMDMTVLAHNLGIKVDVIRAGRHKATGHPLKHMSEDDKALMQAQVNDYFALFTEAVQRFRGMNDDELVAVATGRTFIASQALDHKLIDGIKDFVSGGPSKGAAAEAKGGLSEVLTSAAHVLKTSKNNQEEKTMELSKLTLEELSASRPDLVKKIQDDAAKAAVQQHEESAKKDKADAVAAERARCASISAKGNIKEYAGCGAVVQDAILSGASVAEAESKMKDHRLTVLQTTAAPSAGSPEAPTPEKADPYAGLSFDDRCAKQWAENFAGVQQGFASLDQYKRYAEASENKQARIFKKD